MQSQAAPDRLPSLEVWDWGWDGWDEVCIMVHSAHILKWIFPPFCNAAEVVGSSCSTHSGCWSILNSLLPAAHASAVAVPCQCQVSMDNLSSRCLWCTLHRQHWDT